MDLRQYCYGGLVWMVGRMHTDKALNNDNLHSVLVLFLSQIVFRVFTDDLFKLVLISKVI